MRASGIRRIAVIGAGLMGHGTALEFAAHGYDIRLHDREQTQRARARDSIAEGLGRLVEIGRITSATAPATPDHITLSTDLRSTVANADLVIESVFEDLDVKREVFRDLDGVTPPHAILASNTSTFFAQLVGGGDASTGPRARCSLLLSSLPSASGRAGAREADLRCDRRDHERPVPCYWQASSCCEERSTWVCRQPVADGVLPGSIPIVAAGLASQEDVDIIVKTGFGRKLGLAGPFELADTSGLDIFLAVCEQLFPVIGADSEVSPLLRERVAQNQLGMKTETGFYAWTPESAATLRHQIGQGLAEIARLSDDGASRSSGSASQLPRHP